METFHLFLLVQYNCEIATLTLSHIWFYAQFGHVYGSTGALKEFCLRYASLHVLDSFRNKMPKNTKYGYGLNVSLLQFRQIFDKFHSNILWQQNILIKLSM